METRCAVFIALAAALPTLTSAEDWRRQGGGCKSPGMVKLEDPRINIAEQSGPASARTVRLKGVIEGVCLSEAGLYENGQQRKRINVTTLPTFKRFDFDLTAAAGKRREIRAYNTQGGYSAFALPDTNLQDDPLGIGVDRPTDSEYDDGDYEADDESGSEDY